MDDTITLELCKWLHI